MSIESRNWSKVPRLSLMHPKQPLQTFAGKLSGNRRGAALAYARPLLLAPGG